MKLPYGEQAELGQKLEEYSLNPSHRHGQHKARVFDSRLGITLSNRETLANALRDAAISRGDHGFGETYELRLPLTTAKGTATVLSAWIIRRDEDFPRLTTCFIL